MSLVPFGPVCWLPGPLGTGPPAKVDFARLAAAALFSPLIWEERWFSSLADIFY